MTAFGRGQPGKLMGAELMLKSRQNEDRRSFLRDAAFEGLREKQSTAADATQPLDGKR